MNAAIAHEEFPMRWHALTPAERHVAAERHLRQLTAREREVRMAEQIRQQQKEKAK